MAKSDSHSPNLPCLSCSSDPESGSSAEFRVISISDAAENSKVLPELHASPLLERSSQCVQHAYRVKDVQQKVPGESDSSNNNWLNGGSIQSEELKTWISNAAEGAKIGLNFAQVIRGNSNFHNPAIFEKMIAYCGIDEFGTQVPGRKALEKHDFYDDISTIQELCMKETD